MFQATAIITHKTLAAVALDAAELLGIRSDRVFTMAPSPGGTDLVATEYVCLPGDAAVLIQASRECRV